MPTVRDKHGREMKPGDVLKVYHFTSARHGKRHYLYKHVLRYERGRLVISHLNRVDDAEPWKLGENYYTIGADEGVMRDYEIVQSATADLDERPASVA